MCDSGEADARVAGEFVRYHPAGKAQVVKMGAKMYIMQHLTSTVSCRALFSVSLALTLLCSLFLSPACSLLHTRTRMRCPWLAPGKRGDGAVMHGRACCLTLCAQEPEVSKEALSCVQKLMVN